MLKINPNAIGQDQGRFDFPQVAVVSGSYTSKDGTLPLELAEGDYVTMMINPAGSTPTARGNAQPHLATAFSLVRVG